MKDRAKPIEGDELTQAATTFMPMAIPAFGVMLIQSITMFVVPVFQCIWRERRV